MITPEIVEFYKSINEKTLEEMKKHPDLISRLEHTKIMWSQKTLEHMRKTQLKIQLAYEKFKSLYPGYASSLSSEDFSNAYTQNNASVRLRKYAESLQTTKSN